MNLLLSKNVRRFGLALFWVLFAQTILGQEFMVGNVTYQARGSGEVAVTKIVIPTSETSHDTIVIDIPERVSYGSNEYSVTAIGTGNSTVLSYSTAGYSTYCTIRIPSSVRDLYSGTFAGGNDMLSVEFLPNNNIKSWPEGMFKDSPLGRLVLPEGVWTEIPQDFCRNAAPRELILPDNCRTIGDYAFASPNDNNTYVISHIRLNYGLKTIGSHAFCNTSPITEERQSQRGVNTLTIPSTVTSIGESAFEGMYNIYILEIPGSIKTIPKRAFARWGNGLDLTIGEGVERIETEAFVQNGTTHWTPYGNQVIGLDGLALPYTVKYVGKDAFKDAIQLQSITVNTPTPPQVGGNIVSEDDYSDVWLYVPKNGIYTYQQLSDWKKFKTLKPINDEHSTVSLSQNIKEGGTVSGAGEYSYGERVKISAKPAEGYSFVGWMMADVVVSTDVNYEIIATDWQGMNILAIFAPNTGGTQTHPDNVYTRVDYSPGSYLQGLGFNDIAPRYGAEHAADWAFDINTEPSDNIFPAMARNVEVEFIHAHPDKYPNQTDNVSLTYDVVNKRFIETYGGVGSPDGFLFESEYDTAGNLLPSYTIKMKFPIINTKTGAHDTFCYTADVYMHGVDDPSILLGIEGDRFIYDNIYYVDGVAEGLDTKNGFEVKMQVIRSRDGKPEIAAELNKKFGPGEFNPDSENIGLGDNDFEAFLDLNSRYSGAHMRLSGEVDTKYNYTFKLAARNYNDNGTPRSWIQQTFGEQSTNVDVSKLEAYCGIGYVDRRPDGWSTEEWEELKIDNDVTYLDNSKEAAKEFGLLYDIGYGYSHRNTHAWHLYVKNYPSDWGNCELYQGTERVDEGNNSYWQKKNHIWHDVPKDGAEHTYYLYWPKIGLKRTIIFSDHTQQACDKYRFELDLQGAGFDKVDNLYMIYQTAGGELKEKVIPHDDWRAGSNGNSYFDGFILEEPLGITRVVSLTDTVPLGTAHIIPVPSSLNKVKSYQDFLNNTPTGWDQRGRVKPVTNKITLYGVSEVYFKLVDASTGKAITKGISLNNAEGEVMADGIVRVNLKTNNERPIINAEDGKVKYIPYFFRNGLSVYGNKIDADGYVGHVDKNGKITVTLPMRRKETDSPFDVVNVYYRTPGIDSIKPNYTQNMELPWQPVLYAGPNTNVAFEGSFQPKNFKNDVPTIAVTVAFYDRSFKYDVDNWGTFDLTKLLGPDFSHLTLRAKKKNESWPIYPAPKHGGIYKLDIFHNDFRVTCSDCECYGTMTTDNGSKLVPDPSYKATFITYVFYPHNTIVNPEDEDEVYLSYKGSEIKLGTFKNLGPDLMYLSSEAETEAPVGEERISGMAQMENLDKFDDAFGKFSIDMPENTQAYSPKQFDGLDIELPTQGALLPFNIGVQKINNDIVVRGIISYNFLPGGPVMDMIDKTDLASDIDKLFFDIQRSVTRDKTEYAREDRALGFSTAFVGVRGWLEGRLHQNSRGYFVPQGVDFGLKAEASGFVNCGINTPFFKSTLSLGGELSTYIATEYPDTTRLGWAVNKNAKYFHNLVQHTTVNLNTSFAIGAGIDIYIARAMCGVKGSLNASFDSEVRYRPYLQGARKKYDEMTTKPEIGVPNSYTYDGSRMQVSGDLKAYAEAKFLWWKWRKEFTLASFDKKWYDPDNYTNPIWLADHNEANSRTMLRSSAYKPLRLNAAPENTNIILSDIDTYAEPRYIFGGRNLAYYKINANDMTDGHIMFRNGDTFNGGKGEPIVTADVSSTDNKAVIAYEVSTANADQILNSEEAPKHMGIKASVNNGSGWSVPVMLTGAQPANYTPRTTIDNDGNVAVAWKGGEFVASDYNDADNAGFVSGALYMKRFNGTSWGDDIRLATTEKGKSVSDYAITMLNGKPYMLATIGKESEEDDGIGTEHTLATIGYMDGEDDPIFIQNNGVKATSPQLVNFNGKLFGSAIVTEGEITDTTEVINDVHLYNIYTDGTLEDLGGLGLEKRHIDDYRLVKSDKAMAIIWRESTQIPNETNDVINFTPSVYGALVRSSQNEDGNSVYFLSCPQLIAKADNGLDISFFDAYLPDESSMTGVVTLYDSNTGGANVVESTNYFDNDFTIRHAGIDTKVERGTDYGYYIVVFNEGKDVIDYVDLQFGDDNVTHTIATYILPGHDEVLTDEVLYTAKLEEGIEPNVTPHFNQSILKTRTYAQAKAATAGMHKVNRRRTNRRQKSPVVTPKVQLNVVDMNVRPLSVHLQGADDYYVASTDTSINTTNDTEETASSIPDGYTSILVNVMNDSPIELKPGYTTDISLYYDVKGLKPYEYAHSVQIPKSQFDADGGTTVARILIGKVPENVMVYAVAHTTDAEGNIVKDQNMTNNASPVYLEKNNIEEVPDGIDDIVEDKKPDAPHKFDVVKAENGAMVKGLTEGQTLRIYDISGALLHLYHVKSSNSEHFVSLSKRGVYVFSDSKQSVKLAY